MKNQTSQNPRQVTSNKKRVSFGPVSSISSAPIAIGNSIKGCSSKVTNINGGVRVVGRDFLFPGVGTASTVTNWSVIGGTPISPVAMLSSTLKQYLNMYGSYKINAVVFHYITAAPTSVAGDVIIWVQPNHSSPMLNETSTNFLPFVLSDDTTVIGPQWTNHSTLYRPEPKWIPTDYITDEDPDDEAIADVFLFSKTSSTASPGYLLIDYEIEFRDIQLNVKNLTFPISRAKWSPWAFGGAAITTVVNTSMVVSTYGNDISGSAAALPTGYLPGDIYKIFFDVTNSTFTGGVTPSTMLAYSFTAVVPIVTDGFTLYGGITSSGSMQLYPNLTSARSASGNINWGSSGTSNFTARCWISLVGSSGNSLVQANY